VVAAVAVAGAVAVAVSASGIRGSCLLRGRRIPTLPYNGYGGLAAGLYR